MRRLLAVVSALFVMAPAFAGSHGAHSHERGRGLSVSIDDDAGPVTSCDQIRVKRDATRLPMVEEDVPVGAMRSLRVIAPERGGIRASASSNGSYSVKACKVSLIGRSALPAVTVRGNAVSAADSEDSLVFFIVRAPQNATLDLEATNGQIGVDGVNGTLTARTENGPISVKDSTGKIQATAENGPIAFSGKSGSVTLRAQNGPLAVTLDGNEWVGSLDASSANGPVALQLPRGYRSGVVVESQRGTFACSDELCPERGRRDSFDDNQPRRVAFGTGATRVHLSTVNGPVAISE